MKAMICERIGADATLVFGERPDPAPEAGRVTIAVAAAGVNFADLLMLAGRYQEKPPVPFVPGLEVAGTINALGAGVEGLAVGQRVLALLDHGGYADYASARADDVVALPDDVDDAEAAGFAIAYGTALSALEWRAGLQAGETLLVHGAAGGVGLCALEVGKAMGARVIATARGAERLEVARRAGADLVLDSERADLVGAIGEATGGRGVDVVFDPIGGRPFEVAMKTIAWQGRIVIVGFASGDVPSIRANVLLVKNVAVSGLYWGSYRRHDPARLRDGLRRLLEWRVRGSLRPVVSARLPLERANDALDLLRHRRATGKVVLLTGAPPA
ncbi:MAG: NADPH:quinone oxidoreductase family protein [Geminicoccaceae bacterium]|nr:NADPH:quinone oxidoreductase family protein [Geminicoccaceae bacterium]